MHKPKMNPVEALRTPRTTTTLTWSDGSMGTAFVSVVAGSIDQDTFKRLNHDLQGVIHIHEHESSSHMWNSTTMLHYLNFLTIEIRARRLALGLSLSDSKALVIADKASVHSCEVFEAVRQQWELANNAVLIHGSTYDKVAIPGGFGAAGAPNDGIHQYFHRLRRCYMRVVVGQGNSVAMRRSLENLNLDIDGNPRFKNIGCNVGCVYIIYFMYIYIYINLVIYI